MRPAASAASPSPTRIVNKPFSLDETGTINYCDTYFDEPSSGDHPKLRANKVIWIYSSPPHE